MEEMELELRFEVWINGMDSWEEVFREGRSKGIEMKKYNTCSSGSGQHCNEQTNLFGAETIPHPPTPSLILLIEGFIELKLSKVWFFTLLNLNQFPFL